MSKTKRKTKNNCYKIEKIIYSLTNSTRKKNQLEILDFKYGLTNLCRQHSFQMAKKNKIWHGKNVFYAKENVTSPINNVFKDFFSMIPILNWIVYFLFDKGKSGENVAMMPKGNVKGYKKKIISDYDIANALHLNWMKSSGHKRNILTKDFTKIGIGVKRNRNKFYATELFYG
jgi:uncharacterized protein YkwD